MAEFYSARGWEIPPLPWTNLSPPFSDSFDGPRRLSGQARRAARWVSIGQAAQRIRKATSGHRRPVAFRRWMRRGPLDVGSHDGAPRSYPATKIERSNGSLLTTLGISWPRTIAFDAVDGSYRRYRDVPILGDLLFSRDFRYGYEFASSGGRGIVRYRGSSRSIGHESSAFRPTAGIESVGLGRPLYYPPQTLRAGWRRPYAGCNSSIRKPERRVM